MKKIGWTHSQQPRRPSPPIISGPKRWRRLAFHSPNGRRRTKLSPNRYIENNWRAQPHHQPGPRR
jgi:hypothetical protein